MEFKVSAGIFHPFATIVVVVVVNGYVVVIFLQGYS